MAQLHVGCASAMTQEPRMTEPESSNLSLLYYYLQSFLLAGVGNQVSADV